MSSSRDTLSAFTDAAADAVARVIAEVRRDAMREREAFSAEMRAVRAEWEVRLAAVAEVERRLADRIATLRDGEPGPQGELGPEGPAGIDGRDGATVTVEDLRPMLADMVAEAVATMPTPKDGRDGRDGIDGKDGERGPVGPAGKDGECGPEGAAGRDGLSVMVDDVRPMIEELVAERIAAIPVPKDGRDGIDGRDGERGPEGPAGKMPIVTEWKDRVHYEGDVVTFAGGVYQALQDTGKDPTHEDWRCIVERGEDGRDGRSFTIRGTYAADGEYRMLDVVALNGASFTARHDDPGPCPGAGWQLIAGQGKQGKPGAPGRPGSPGVALTASVRAARISGEGVLTLVNADGSEIMCDFYPLLSRIG